jgi:hypothetical protein
MLAWLWLFLSPFVETRSTVSTMDEMSPPPGQVPGVVTRAAAGDREAIVELLERLEKILNALPGDSGGQGP